MAPSCKVPLPTGSLKVAFKGDIPKVSGVDQASPMYGAFKIGYTVLELELGDGTVMQGLDTRELVAALNEHSNDPKRRMKMEMNLPKESVIVLQAGEHGLIIEDKFGKAMLTRIERYSPLRKQVRVGMICDTVKFEDGYSISGHSADEINDALDAASQTRKRTLVLKSPDSDLSPRSGALPSGKTIVLPAGTCEDLGLKISGTVAKISQVMPGSALAGQIRPGYIVDTLSHPDGHEFAGFNGANLSKCIDRTAGARGRIVTLVNPNQMKQRAGATTKIMLPHNGSLGDFGIKVSGSPALIESVDGRSSFQGMIFRGFRVQMCGWSDGTEFADLDGVELDEVIEESSGIPGRFLYMENTAGSAPSVVEYVLSPGKLGTVFSGTPPRITRVNPGSQLEGVVDVGMCADTLSLENGIVHYQMSTMEFTNALKSSGNSENRKVRFVKVEEVGLKSKPAMALTEEMTIPLPTGKLGVVFKGNQFPAVITRVNSDSSLLGKVAPGMAVDVVTVKRRDHMEMNASEVGTLLKSTSDIPGRMLKIRDPSYKYDFARMPDELEVVLPAGKLGCTFTGNPPVPKTFRENSPVTGSIPPGMFVDCLVLPDGFRRSGFNTREFVTLLNQTTEEDGRVLILKNIKNCEPSVREEVFPMDKTVTLPTGRIGLSFKGRKNARISRLHDDCKLAGQVYKGMIVDTITIPGGSSFSGMTSKEAARVLSDTKAVGGRTMTLKGPDSTDLSVRNITSDDASIGGNSQNMSAGFSTANSATFSTTNSVRL
eukprot:CAMPEP_0194129492 /NCGR_PEP_ID=MMETSP0152-20130528/690_1 /TAXON_ID=1049557 /ORGANISM="Thalassiothrix antarctica, Strain L6-D1" /LENGTH=769 /DNA_ID=CAMNT_0038823693 /DNA_START=59 /DNA_END=2368 /DNA_ORIENTATION=-